MSDLAATAERLRDVKEATRNFLTLWALEQLRRRVRDEREQLEAADTTAIESAIMELDVFGNPDLARAVLDEGPRQGRS